ncbi:Disease resistance protein RGA2 [Ananas comosus]|uniref:Disease resistance protein RGA2 n=1 Tax=Ananas comosus TaxID=4615 RepID=A0A199UTB6_ANACO|nr:Disease resistance protein RGA2 [Ananas comosus]
MRWLLSFAKEVVQSAAASVAANELVRLLPSLDHDLEVLRTTLLTTRLRVDKAEQWRFKNPHFDQLLMQLKAAFYDAEDLIAEFDYVELQQKIEGGHASLLLSSPLDFVKNLISRAPDKVRQYQRRLDDAATALEKVIVDLNFRDEPKRSDVLRRRQTGSFVTEPEVFGRDEEREKVIALLLRPGGESGRTSNSESVPAKRIKRDNVSVLPIVGIGGMGKTTLAQVVFNDPRVRHYFETRIWICVSEIFDVKRLTKEVINNVDLSHQTDGKNSSWSRDSNVEEVLLVLERCVGMRTKWKWEKFYAPMRNGYRGSMILTTTGRPADSFWEFFKIRAFGYGNEKVDQELESIAKKIATKLKGTPLAAKTVGGLLKEKMDAKHWRSIMNSEMWKLRQGENDIFPALQLSYQYLPPHLKRCFAICSIFPKDHEIDEVSLIELWLAQGFVTSEDNMLPEDVATRYLSELTSRSFLRLSNPTKKYYVIHNLMHDLA